MGRKRRDRRGAFGRAVPNASAHLRSRHEVAEILLKGAPVIIGSGSASFEMLRYLTERLPAMVCPRWVHNRIQPMPGELLRLRAEMRLPGRAWLEMRQDKETV